MKSSTALLALSLLLNAAPSFAKSPSEDTGFKQDVSDKCSVWAPSTLRTEDYAVRYAGPCANGRAEGKGQADWLFVYSNMKVKATWSGNFHNGVFLGNQKISGRVEPIGGDQYLIDMGRLNNGEITYVATSNQDTPPDLCSIDRLIVVPVREAILSNDSQAQQLFQESAKHYVHQCPDGKRTFQLEMYRSAVTPRNNGMLPSGIAHARYNADRSELSDYSNQVTEEARRAERKAEAETQQLEARKRFDAFTRQHGIVAWVTTQQLDENPFRWEGKKIGVIVQLDRMLSRESALVGPTRNWGPDVLLKGITPEFPGNRTPVLVAAQVGKREPAPGSDSRHDFTSLQAIETRICEKPECGDWLAWSWRSNDLIWGEPYSSKK